MDSTTEASLKHFQVKKVVQSTFLNEESDQCKISLYTEVLKTYMHNDICNKPELLMPMEKVNDKDSKATDAG